MRSSTITSTPSATRPDEEEHDIAEDPFTTQPTQPREPETPVKQKLTPATPAPSGEHATGERETGERTAPRSQKDSARQPSQALPHTRRSGMDSTSWAEQPSQALQPPHVNHIPSWDDIRTWVLGANVPANAALDLLSNKQLGCALVHHKMILQVPKDWWIDPITGQYLPCTVLATGCNKIAGQMYLNCQVIKPDKARREGQIIQFPVGKTNGNRPLHVRRLLDLRFNNPRTLGDL
mmetsp:Transcript_61418/g.126829  ORF Transcript_61418/g.126829 Transcript_61418/m.126829 type:complete len:236 (-) Transcript_61418:251-958(-)